MGRRKRRKTRSGQAKQTERHERPKEDGPPRLDLPVRPSRGRWLDVAGKAVQLIGQLAKAAEAVDHLFKNWN